MSVDPVDIRAVADRELDASWKRLALALAVGDKATSQAIADVGAWERERNDLDRLIVDLWN